MISTRVMDIKLREAAEGLGEDGSGKKKSKFKTFKKLFGKKKRKESPSSAENSTWKPNQAQSEVIAIESGPVGYDSEDELEESRGTLGSRALSHDSIFIPESGQDPARPVRVFSQENVCDRIKALQLKIQCNVKMGPPPPGALPTKRADDTGMSSEDDGLPRSPPEMSLLHDVGPSTTIKISLVSSSRPQSPDHTSNATVSSQTLDSSLAPVADFSHPPEFSSCLDNSAAKHKLLVKPRNQRSSKMRRLSSRAQSESLCDLTWTLEEEDYEEKSLPQVRAEESPSSGQQELMLDRQPEPGGLATLLAPGGARARRARLQHSPALSASMEEGSSPADEASSHPATPEVIETMVVPAPCGEAPSLPEGSPHPSPHREIQKEELPAVGPSPPVEDTAEEMVCASGDAETPLSTHVTEESAAPSEGATPPSQGDSGPPEGDGALLEDTTPPEDTTAPEGSTTLPKGDTTPSEADTTPLGTVIATTLQVEAPSGPDGQDQRVQEEAAPTAVTTVASSPEAAGTESTQALARSPPGPKSCLKHKGPAVDAAAPTGPPAPAPAESPPGEPRARAQDEATAPERPLPAGPERAAPGRRSEPRGARKFSVSSCRARARAGASRALLRSGPAWRSEAALDDLPGPPEPPPRKLDPPKPKPADADPGDVVAGPGRSPQDAAPALGAGEPGAAQEAAPSGERGAFPVKLRSTSLSAKFRDGAAPEAKGLKRYSAEMRLERGGLTLLPKEEQRHLGAAPGPRGTKSPNGQGKGKARSPEQPSAKPPLPRKPLLQSFTLPYPPAGPDAGPVEPEKALRPPGPRKEKSLHRGAEKGLPPAAAGSGADGKPTPSWITTARQKQREVPDQPPNQEDKPVSRILKTETGKPAKAPERVQEPMKQADFVRSKSFLMTPAKPAVSQRQGAKLSLKEGLQRGISLSHQNLAQAAVMTEKELHQLKRASYASTDQPSWMELARKKSQAWSDMPQIIK
nr:CRACD-like protein [Jaculus jaculus]XP_045003772.1 CRACD-like protein [Jaculus jaculus]XP_045003773.1 CRACD-like protein [Jaculus jaculus]XP_045003774.1 CRACD-like protein [Jaculus jaculus]